MLERYKSCLTLEEIFIDDLKLERSEKFEEDNNDKIFFRRSDFIDDNFIAKLGCEGYVNGYSFSVSVNGIFTLKIDKDSINEDEERDLITTRPVSILFPCLRSEVINLTMKTNGKPVVIPIVNVDRFLNNEAE